MDNSISDSMRQEAKSKYTIMLGVLGLLTAGLWATIGCAIHFAPSSTPYWAGACACGAMLVVLTLCTVRVYMLVQEVTEQNKDKLRSMIDVANLFGILCVMGSVAGFISIIHLGLLSLCSTIYDEEDGDNCINESQNKILAPILMAICFLSLFVSIGIQVANHKTKTTFRMHPMHRFAQVNVTLQQQQLNQLMLQQHLNQQMNAGQGYNWGQFQSQPQTMYPSQGQNGLQQPPPPPSYFSATDQPMYPPQPNQQTQFGIQ